jgi:cytochrome c-type biogenesis protein CcmE
MAMTRKQRRLVTIGVIGSVLAVAVGLVLFALSGEITLYRTPTEIAQSTIGPNQRLRVGGLVETGSVVRGADGEVSFSVTDTATSLKVSYRGLLPDLFREGQGVVAEGKLGPDGSFRADTVLAKHDERYMPKEVADALKKQGVWEGDGPVPASAQPPAPSAIK